MIYKFRSRASGDVLMTSPVCDRLLGIVGREISAQGILQPRDMPSAMRALEIAVIEDESRPPIGEVEVVSKAGEMSKKDADAVKLRQHAWPLLGMISLALASDESIVRGV